MPAAVLVVHQETNVRERILTALRAAGHSAAGFDDPLMALDAIESDSRVRVLVTRVDFGEGRLNGIALARMLHHKRLGVKVVFVGRPEYAQQLGESDPFFPHPVDTEALAVLVGYLLAEKTEPA